MATTTPRANDLFRYLISEGLIKSGHRVDAGTAAVQMPVTYCPGCQHQLVTHWFWDGSQLFCLYCALDREHHYPGTVKVLLEGQETWLEQAHCRCPRRERRPA